MKFSNVNKNFVVVEPIEPQKSGETVTEAGIHLLSAPKHTIKNMGRIVALAESNRELLSGLGIDPEEARYEIGDVIMFHPHSFHEFQYDGKTYFVVRLSDVYFTLKEDEATT